MNGKLKLELQTWNRCWHVHEFGGGGCLLQCTVVLKLSGQTSGLMSFLNKSIKLDQADLNLVVARQFDGAGFMQWRVVSTMFW